MYIQSSISHHLCYFLPLSTVPKSSSSSSSSSSSTHRLKNQIEKPNQHRCQITTRTLHSQIWKQVC